MSVIWNFGAEGSGLFFNIVYDGASWTFTMVEGKLDLNALWFSDRDASKGGTWSLAKSDSSLGMNGAASSGIVWDEMIKLSSAGLGKAGTSKSTYLTAGETYTLSSAELGQLGSWDDGITDWSSITIGVRATSVSGAADGATSIKYTAVGAELNESAYVFVTAENGAFYDLNGNQKLDLAEATLDNQYTPTNLEEGEYAFRFIGWGATMDRIDLSGFGDDDEVIIDYTHSWIGSSLPSTAVAVIQRGFSAAGRGFNGYTFSRLGGYTGRNSAPGALTRSQYANSFTSEPTRAYLDVRLKMKLVNSTRQLRVSTTNQGSFNGVPTTPLPGLAPGGFRLASWSANTTIDPTQISVLWPGNYTPPGPV